MLSWDSLIHVSRTYSWLSVGLTYEHNEVKVAQLCLTLWKPMDYRVCGILQARILEWVAVPFSRGFSQPRIKPRSPALQVDSLSAEPPGKPRNTGVGSLSLLQWIFPIQELNWVLLRCRWILYQLSYQGSQHEFGSMQFLTVWPWASLSTSPSLSFLICKIQLLEGLCEINKIQHLTLGPGT